MIEMRAHLLGVGAIAIAAATACSGGVRSTAPKAPESVVSLRDAGDGSGDGEAVGRWLRAEMVAPGGSAANAARARKRLDSVKHDGLWASLARGADDELHGAPQA